MEPLHDTEIHRQLTPLEDWNLVGKSICKRFDRGDFMGSVAFVNAIAEPAEKMQHHPDIAIEWSQVEVTITTHSVEGLTAADFELARRIDELA